MRTKTVTRLIASAVFAAGSLLAVVQSSSAYSDQPMVMDMSTPRVG
jgi:hypothetical protein